MILCTVLALYDFCTVRLERRSGSKIDDVSILNSGERKSGRQAEAEAATARRPRCHLTTNPVARLNTFEYPRYNIWCSDMMLFVVHWSRHRVWGIDWMSVVMSSQPGPMMPDNGTNISYTIHYREKQYATCRNNETRSSSREAPWSRKCGNDRLPGWRRWL